MQTLPISNIDPIELDTTASLDPALVCVGGVGGSGTRIVARILSESGIFIGTNVNDSLDNFDYPHAPLLKALFDATTQTEIKRLVHEPLAEFERTMHQQRLAHGQGAVHWGWKVPTAFYLLHFSASYFLNLRYIHVIRHGLDMAFSRNQNQLRNWGPRLGISPSPADDPVASLSYWIEANRFALDQARRVVGNNFLLVNFDELCDNPIRVILAMTHFLGIECPPAQVQALASLVVPPESRGRYSRVDWRKIISTEQLKALESFGFHVDA